MRPSWQVLPSLYRSIGDVEGTDLGCITSECTPGVQLGVVGKLPQGHFGTSFPQTCRTPLEWIWSIQACARKGPQILTGCTRPCSMSGRMRNFEGCLPSWRSILGAWPRIFIRFPAVAVPTESCGKGSNWSVEIPRAVMVCKRSS